jgi:hypothetical protein
MAPIYRLRDTKTSKGICKPLRTETGQLRQAMISAELISNPIKPDSSR